MKKYYVNNEEVSEEKFALLLEEINDEYCENNYDEWLDEICEEVNICGYNYQASHALRLVDPVAYRCGLSDFQSSELSNHQYFIEQNGYEHIDEYTFEVIEEDESEVQA